MDTFAITLTVETDVRDNDDIVGSDNSNADPMRIGNILYDIFDMYIHNLEVHLTDSNTKYQLTGTIENAAVLDRMYDDIIDDPADGWQGKMITSHYMCRSGDTFVKCNENDDGAITMELLGLVLENASLYTLKDY